VIDALAARFGGAAYAAIQTARRFADNGDFAEVVVVARRGSMVADGLAATGGVRVLSPSAASTAELARRLAWETITLPREVAGGGRALVLTWSGMLPRRLPAPVTSYLANPVMFQTGGLANMIRRGAVRWTSRDARHVAVPTLAMAELVRESLGVQVDVVPLGIDHSRFVPDGDAVGEELLCVADFYAHKRHDLVLDAWARLREPRPLLRLIGDPRVDASNYGRVASRIARYRSLGAIEVEHGVPLATLVRRYQRARVFVMASEFESFCMPLLEAQACGVPAIARNLPALRETGGEGTTFVDDGDVSTWAASLERLLRDEAARRAARERAIAHASRFSWDRTAESLVALLRSAAA
jgi:glycosyltransferase involved in cell wall biosynthesis